MTLGRLWRTVRHLRTGQVIGRARFRLARPKPELAPPPPPRAAAAGWVQPARRAPSLVGPDRFRFLNEEGDLAECGWDDPARAKLWRYNQHYFDDLNARGAAERGAWHRDLIAAWLAANPPAGGSGWEPYPTSLRIVNWVKWALAGNALSPNAVASLAVQARWLMRRLEWHLLGNHLFVNAKALVFAGLYFDGPEAWRWLEKGRSILARELPEQILADGGQFELSPMYHALALEDVLDLINLASAHRAALPPAQARQLDDWRARVPAMRGWLAAMSHPDGRIAFFNDAAFGIAPENDELFAYAARLGLAEGNAPPATIRLAQSGYARLALGDAVLIADVAAVGPDYLPGHAHADTLSFELSLGARRLMVNSGTSVYGADAERQRQRGTAAHSAVEIDGRDSSEVWSGFRTGRRARPFDVEMSDEGAAVTLAAAHDGYAFLAGKPIHRRTWRLDADGLTITDRVTASRSNRRGHPPAPSTKSWRGSQAAPAPPSALAGGGRGVAASSPHEAVLYFHLAPEISAISQSDGSVRLEAAGAPLATVRAEAGAAIDIRPSTFHPEFGLSLPNRRLEIRLSRPLPIETRTTLEWSRP